MKNIHLFPCINPFVSKPLNAVKKKHFFKKKTLWLIFMDGVQLPQG